MWKLLYFEGFGSEERVQGDKCDEGYSNTYAYIHDLQRQSISPLTCLIAANKSNVPMNREELLCACEPFHRGSNESNENCSFSLKRFNQ